MKKIITIVLIAVILLGAVIGLGVATKGFTNWNPKTWVENFKPDDKKPTGDVASGILVSEKYGTFVIPEGNMFATFGYGQMVGFPSGTNLSYINEYITDKYNEVTGTDYSNLNFAYSGYGGYNAEMFKDNVLKVYQNSDVRYHFVDDILKYDITHEDAIMGVHLDSFIAVSEEFSTFPIGYGNAPNVPDESILIDAQETTFSLHARVLARKVTITYDNISQTIYVPTVIISDMGVPLTDDIYNEITGKKV